MKLTTTTPYKHQEHVIELSKDRPYFALFMEQGTGKTLVSIATFTYLFLTDKINGVLILATSGVQDVWIQNEIPAHCLLSNEELIYTAAWHSADGKAKRQRWDYVANHAPKNALTVLAANIEAIRTENFRDSIKEFVSKRNWMLIIDESTSIKNHKAQQTKECFRLAPFAKYTRIMTGTPITQSPLDLFSQCRVLNPQALPYTSWTAFKCEFANEIQQRFGHRSFAKIIGFKNEEKLSQIIANFSYRILKKECLDLPPKVYKIQPIELTPQQKKIYQDLVTMSMSQLGTGDMITVTVIITLLLRLHQTVLGYVQSDSGALIHIPHNRITSLLTLLEENPTKAIIFCRFLQDVHQVANAIETKYPHSVVRYSGEESAAARHQATTQFQTNDQCRYFVATSAASKGLTLTAAEQVIYYSQDYRLETRLQSEDRAHRSGQTKTVVYTDMFCEGTVEGAIIKSLKAKQELATSVMDRAALLNLVQLT